MHNHAGMIKSLVGEGADLEAKNGALPSTEAATLHGDDGNTAPINSGRMETTTPAARRGDTKGKTAVHMAIYFSRAEALGALLQAGADPNAHDSSGRSPLWLACSGRLSDTPGCVAMVHELLEAGADPSMAANGTLPLHLAAQDGSTGLIDLLLTKAPATLNHGCEKGGGSTPLGRGVAGGHESAILHLLSAGSKRIESDAH